MFQKSLASAVRKEAQNEVIDPFPYQATTYPAGNPSCLIPPSSLACGQSFKKWWKK